MSQAQIGVMQGKVSMLAAQEEEEEEEEESHQAKDVEKKITCKG